MEYNNFKNTEAGCDKYGKQRLELAIFLRDNILNKINFINFIENGTLLGAYRNNKFIDHDDDFDFGILLNSIDEIKDIYNFIKNNLPSKYDCKLLNTYSFKIEIFNPKYGKYLLLGPKYNNAEYHFVTIDLQFYLKKDDNYQLLYFINPYEIIINKNLIIPTKKILLENEEFNCPNNTVEFLKLHYGSIKEGAKYCSKTGKYID